MFRTSYRNGRRRPRGGPQGRRLLAGGSERPAARRRHRLSRTTARYATARPGFGRPVRPSPGGDPHRLDAVPADRIRLAGGPARRGSSGSWWPLVIFGVENLLLLSTLGSTFGQRLLG